MLYLHKRTNTMYRKLLDAFDVERQVPMVVYTQLGTGAVFTREADAFAENFEFKGDAQSEIVPRNKNQTELPLDA
jgi:hypothetical protein